MLLLNARVMLKVASCIRDNFAGGTSKKDMAYHQFCYSNDVNHGLKWVEYVRSQRGPAVDMIKLKYCVRTSPIISNDTCMASSLVIHLSVSFLSIQYCSSFIRI